MYEHGKNLTHPQPVLLFKDSRAARFTCKAAINRVQLHRVRGVLGSPLVFGDGLSAFLLTELWSQSLIVCLRGDRVSNFASNISECPNIWQQRTSRIL